MTLKDLVFFLKDGIHFVIDLKETNYGYVGHRIKGESIEDVTFAGAPLDQFLIESIEPDFDEDGAFLRIEVKEKDGISYQSSNGYKGMLWETRLNIKSKNASGSKMALNISRDAASWKTEKAKIGDIVLIAASPCWI